MDEQSHQPEKKFEIIQQWHRQKPNEKIYKIRLYMIGNMIKAQQKLKMKYERNFSQNLPSTTSLGSKPNNNDDDDLFDTNITEDLSTQLPPTIQSQSSRPILEKPIKIYEDFKDRGKFDTLKFHFNRLKQRITIILSQNYFINELKCKQFDLLMVYQSFTKVWQEEYLQIMQAFIKYSKDFKANEIIKFQFVAIDILGVTFDIAYNNKVAEKISELKRFRFRYSAFEFRQNPFFDQKNTQQIMSFVEVHPGNISNASHQDFYSSMRLGFVDDINNNNNDLWRRMITRFWVFYQLHCLNRGMTDFQEFNKKVLGRVHFHSIRMKKFQLIFPFPLLNKSIMDERKEATLYLTFYLDDKDISMTENGLEFKMTVNLVEHHGVLSFEQKKQLIFRLKKDTDNFMLVQKNPPLESNEIFEFYLTLKFDDKISRAFAKFETIVSFFIDKLAFNDIRSNIRQCPEEQQQKIIELYSKSILYKQNQYLHTHQLCLQLKHKYLTPIVLQNSSVKYMDEIQFFKLSKKKRKWNQKQKKDEGFQKCDICIHDQLKRYITQILRTKPLRECHRQIMEYIENVVKVIFRPFEDTNIIQRIQTRQTALSTIITNIIRLLQLGNHHSRKSQISIITEDSPLMMREEDEDDLIAEITFNIKDLKIYWIKRLPSGYIIIRMRQKSIEVVKDLNSKKIIPLDYNNIQYTSNELIKQLKNILMKEFATLQNMMV